MAGTSQPTTKDGNIILRRVSTPNRVAPGEGYEVEVEVSNGAAYINPWDGDKCGLAPPGYKLNVVLIGPDGERRESGAACHTTTEVGTRDETYSFELQAPTDTGNSEVEAYVEMVNSGKRTDALTTTFLVDPDDSEQADDPTDGDGGDGDVPNFLDGGGDGSGGSGLPIGGGGPAKKIMLLVGLLAVAWLASSTSDTVEAVA